MRARTLAVLTAIILLGAASAALLVSCSVAPPAEAPKAAASPPAPGLPQGRAFLLGGHPTQIVIVQTPEVQASIEKLLNDIRHRRGLPPKHGETPSGQQAPGAAAQTSPAYEMRLYDVGDIMPTGPSAPSRDDAARDIVLLIKQSCSPGTWEGPFGGGVIYTGGPPVVGTGIPLPESEAGVPTLWRPSRQSGSSDWTDVYGQLEENDRGHGHRTGWPQDIAGMARRLSAGKPPEGAAAFSADELWIIESPEAPAAAAGGEEEGPGSGALMAVLPGEMKEVPVPLKHTDVRAAISGYIATVEVNQQFHNPYDAEDRGEVRLPAAAERGRQRVPDDGRRPHHPRHHPRARGGRAHLRRGARPGLRRQPAHPGAPQHLHPVGRQHRAGQGDRHRHQVLQHARLRGRLVRVRLPDGRRPALQSRRHPRRASAPSPAAGPASPARRPRSSTCGPTSAADTTSRSPSTSTPACPSRTSPASTTPSPPRARATAAPPSSSARSTASRTRTSSCATRWPADASSPSLLVQRDKGGGYFTLMLFPPDDLARVQRAPMEMVFVLDCSGSMNGAPIAKAKDAVKRALRRLGPDDTFQVIRFSQQRLAARPGPRARHAGERAQGPRLRRLATGPAAAPR